MKKASENNAIIFLGDLKGLGNKDTGKRKTMNRIANTMPYYKLTKMIEYKAKEKGVQVVQVKRNTSRTCHRCGSLDTVRPRQGRFDCKNCGLQDYNADLNGAKNILHRFLAYMVGNGASMNRIMTKAFIEKNNAKISEKILGNPFLTSLSK